MKKIIIAFLTACIFASCTKETSVEQPKKDTVPTYRVTLKYKR